MVEGRRRRTVRNREPDLSSWPAAEREAYLDKQRRATPVAEMALPVRTINTLEDHGIIMAGDVVRQTYTTLMAMANFGEKTLEELRAAVVALGLPPPNWERPPRPPAPPRKTGKRSILEFWS